MARYIDADKLIDALNYNTQNTWGKGLGTSWWSHSVKLKDNIVECINNQPTADVVEVVRCKDCKHGEVSVMSKTKDGEEEILCYCNAKNKVTDLDYYCACGTPKRKAVQSNATI